MSDHQDIADLAEQGDLAEAQALLEARVAKEGVSGEDLQALTALLNKPPKAAPSTPEAPAAEAEDTSSSEAPPQKKSLRRK